MKMAVKVSMIFVPMMLMMLTTMTMMMLTTMMLMMQTIMMLMEAEVKMAVKVLQRLFIPSSHSGYNSTADKLPLCDSYGLNY